LGQRAKKVIRYSDPEGEHRISEAEAIARQRAAGLARGYVYESDGEALADFMAVNWAINNATRIISRRDDHYAKCDDGIYTTDK
jgi:hypothetical protein